MTPRITSTLVALGFLLVAAGITTGGRTSNAQTGLASEDDRKKAGFDPRQFPGDDLTTLLNDKKFSNGKHVLKTFADGSKLTIETKSGKIRRAYLIEPGGSRSDATIHSPVGTATAFSFTLGVHVQAPKFERCYICTFGRDNQQQSRGAQPRERRRLVKCHTAPCDDFYPEPGPPTIEPLKKSKSL